jgi:hypothetical protein
MYKYSITHTMSMQFTSFTDFKPSGVSFDEPKPFGKGGKQVRLRSSDGKMIQLTTPLMTTWGANRIEDENTGSVKYNMSLQFPQEGSDYSNDSIQEFYTKMRNFQTMIIDAAEKHSAKWFGKKKSREVIEDNFSVMLKHPKIKGPDGKPTEEPDMSRPPTMRLKIPYWEGKFNLELYDTEGNLVFDPSTVVDEEKTFESFIPKLSKVACGIRCNGIWFVNGNFGVTWQFVQGIVSPPAALSGQCGLTLTSSDREQLKAPVDTETMGEAHDVQESATVTEAPKVSVTVEDSDDDESSDDEPESEPEPEPVKKKRQVRKPRVKKT